MKCYRPDCENELNSGRKYCSARCNALDRKRVKLQKANTAISPQLISHLETAVGAENASLIALEVNKFLQDERISIPLPESGQTYGDMVLSYDGTKEYRPSTTLSFDVIDKMLRSGPVVFAMEMKRAQVFRVFSQGRYKVISPDKELAEVAEASLHLIFPKMMHDVTWSAFSYGTSFSEEIWERKTRYQLGMTDDAADKTEFIVPKVPNSVNPGTIDHIRRNEDESFNGFAQRRRLDGTSSIDPILVDREQALVIPLNEHFRNLWGESTLKPMYTLWLWYEIIFRTMVRYMDRMAIPWKIAKAPSRATVTVSGSSAPVKAMDLAVALAANIDKSGVAAIPSDVDENGNHLWDISLLTAEGRVQLFLEVLQYLGQEMIRAALSADRSLSQTSGGVGSYNIGEVHAAASAVTSEMILLQILHYLNMYFVPEFSLYNRGSAGPPIWLRTQAIDTQERELLMQLIGVAGNSPAAQELFYMVDWRTMLETSNIPSKTEEEVQELKDTINKEQEEKMKTQQEIMAKNQAPIPKGGASAFANKDAKKPANGNTATESELDNIALENIFQHQIPWMLGEHEARVLYDSGLIGEEIIKLFNPHHDRSSGRFASGRGGSLGRIAGGGSPDAGGVVADIALKNDVLAKSASSGFTLTTGKILGLTGLGLVGLAVINRLNSQSSFDEYMDQKRQQDAEKSGDLQQRLDQLTVNWPRTNSPEEAAVLAETALRNLGLSGLPSDLTVQIGSTSGGIGGYYDYNTNSIVLSPEMASNLATGDPSSMWALVHEIAHSDQEVPGQDPNFGNSDQVKDGFNNAEFRSFMEGQNDLVASLAMSQMYGQPMTQSDAANMSNEYGEIQSNLASISTGTTIMSGGGSVYTEIGYPEESATWAAIATASAQEFGGTPEDFLIDSHATGFSANEQHQILVNLFPDEMSSGGYYIDSGGTIERDYPSQSEIRVWMDDHGYVSPDLALQQMLQEAAGG